MARTVGTKGEASRRLIFDLERFPEELGRQVGVEVRKVTPTHRSSIRYYKRTRELRAHIAVIVQDRGRRPGSKAPPVQAIEAWISKRGISLRAAYPIARHIGLYGYPGKNFVPGAINEAIATVRARAKRKKR